jgi:hypothetical protein
MPSPPATALGIPGGGGNLSAATLRWELKSTGRWGCCAAALARGCVQSQAPTAGVSGSFPQDIDGHCFYDTADGC